MNTRASRITVVVLVVVGASLGLGAMADTMLLKAEGGEAEVVTFEHKAHTIDRSIACTDCHHNMAEVGTPLCSQCHVLAKGDAPVDVGPGEPKALEQAFHDSCLGCHREPPKGATPPVECAQCHVPATPAPADVSAPTEAAAG